MDEHDLEVLLKYPLLDKVISDDVVTYKGAIEVQNKSYSISLKPGVDGSFDIELIDQFEPYKSDILNCLKTSNNLLRILDNITTIINNHVDNNIENSTNIYQRVLHEYVEFTRFHLNLKSSKLSHDLSKIEAAIVDDGNREHAVAIKVDYQAGRNIFMMENYDLPLKSKDNDLFKPCGSLNVLFDQFLAYVERLQPYFELMDALDKSCLVWDPVAPQKRDNYRRICVGGISSVIITVDAFNADWRPEFKFIGPDHLIDPMRERLNQNLHKWESGNTLQQILDVLNLQTDSCKQPPKMDTEEVLLRNTGDCSICLCLQLNSKPPDVVCDNKTCENCFHSTCLYQWLITANNTRRVFSNIVGQCPNCEKPISCPIQD